MDILYKKASMKYATSYCHAVDKVAKERLYLAATKGFPEASTISLLQDVEKRNLSLFFAISSNEVIGWCDILPKYFEGLEHIGILGMGVLKEFRNKGVGKELLKLAINHVKDVNNLEKIELEVFKSNHIAIKMYENLGFLHEGERINSRKLDNNYDNIILMGKMI